MSEYTDDQLVEIVRLSLAAGDVTGVDAALRVLAVQNPRLAQDVLDTLRLGLVMTGTSR